MAVIDLAYIKFMLDRDGFLEEMMSHRAELLVPAGSLEKLRTAVLYGADAVYLGTPDMSLRTKSKFTLEEII